MQVFERATIYTSLDYYEAGRTNYSEMQAGAGALHFSETTPQLTKTRDKEQGNEWRAVNLFLL